MEGKRMFGENVGCTKGSWVLALALAVGMFAFAPNASAQTAGCQGDGDCVDADMCTDDTCDTGSGLCFHTPRTCGDNDVCTDDTCDPTTGCQHSSISCDDTDACTDDSCDPVNGCQHSSISCDDSDACTNDSCDAATGCQHSTSTCDDSDACTDDNCDATGGCTHTPRNCGDSDLCTDDSCDPTTGCQHSEVNCDDTDGCTDDSCDAATGCQHSTTDCDDTDECTDDSCDPATGCQHSNFSCDDSDECTDDSCDTATGCTHTPNNNCGGGEGCTPGFWKQIDVEQKKGHHLCHWTDPPYGPDTLFSDVFDDAFPGQTLHDVLNGRGGGLTALGRHTVSALLNAASPDVDYDMTVGEIIAAFNATWMSTDSDISDLKDLFEGFNELGCPVGNCKVDVSPTKTRSYSR